MSAIQRRAFLLACLAITAFAGPKTAVDLWRGLRGPYIDGPGIQVAAENGPVVIVSEDETR